MEIFVIALIIYLIYRNKKKKKLKQQLDEQHKLEAEQQRVEQRRQRIEQFHNDIKSVIKQEGDIYVKPSSLPRLAMVGMKYNNHYSNIATGVLKKDVLNPVDANAVCFTDTDGEIIAYVPKREVSKANELFDDRTAIPYVAYIEMNDNYVPVVGHAYILSQGSRQKMKGFISIDDLADEIIDRADRLMY